MLGVVLGVVLSDLSSHRFSALDFSEKVSDSLLYNVLVFLSVVD